MFGLPNVHVLTPVRRELSENAAWEFPAASVSAVELKMEKPGR